MTKKHYIIIAELIKENIFYMNNGGLVINSNILYSLLKEMKKDNPNFKEDIFITACGLEKAEHFGYKITKEELSLRNKELYK
jgi:hypothetical protein